LQEPRASAAHGRNTQLIYPPYPYFFKQLSATWRNNISGPEGKVASFAMIYEIFISINKRLQKSFSMVIMTQNFCGDLSKFKSTNLGEPPYPGTRKTVTQCCQSKPQGGNLYLYPHQWGLGKPIQSPQHPLAHLAA